MSVPEEKANPPINTTGLICSYAAKMSCEPPCKYPNGERQNWGLLVAAATNQVFFAFDLTDLGGFTMVPKTIKANEMREPA